MKKHGCYKPSMDLLDLFLRLAAKHDMKFWFGLYDSGKYWDTNVLTWEIEDNKFGIDEVWKNYGHHKSFGGWYISTEISRKTKGAVEAFRAMGRQCKDVSGGLPTLISPWIDGKKAVFDKLRLKLEAAKRANYRKAITFEFSHFMSPQSAYLQAGHLYDCYRDYFNIL